MTTIQLRVYDLYLMNKWTGNKITISGEQGIKGLKNLNPMCSKITISDIYKY